MSTAELKDKTENLDPERPREGENSCEEAPEPEPLSENGAPADDIAGAADDPLAAERDRYLRLAAEYDNFRKRSAKEREALYAQVRCDTIAKLLPVYDNLARALRQECTDDAFYKGVEMTMAGLCEILGNLGIMEIESVGAKFDPERHRALSHCEDPQLGEGTITEEFEKGFTFGGKVIRFAAVAVAN
ncbi:MAG: nucleotide exchange factor GrpE [Oscillospiraceae bacterium]|nr:nucleotide exchange factor GrpE [Oscillospiraceae bacterium]